MRLKLNIETAVLYLDYSHMRDISLYIAGRLLKAKHTAVLSVLHTGVGRVVQSRRYSYIDTYIYTSWCSSYYKVLVLELELGRNLSLAIYTKQCLDQDEALRCRRCWCE